MAIPASAVPMVMDSFDCSFDNSFCSSPNKNGGSFCRSPNKNGENWEDSLQFAAITYVKALCGSSTVAIDNKIEQAMDLVKSHLMYAVREEVEVLKEQIKELTERNNQLELENQILMAAASQETISKLAQLKTQAQQQSLS